MTSRKDTQGFGATPAKPKKPGRLAAFAMLVLLALPAAADLMIFPTRIVFDGHTRTAQVDLVNTGDRAATYRIGVTQRRMNEFGNFSPVDTPLPGELFADQMIRYSPRQVVLGPGAGQAVRLLLRKPEGLADGEYRSHVVFERVPEPPTRSPDAVRDVEIHLSALISVSIPIIVRHGDTSATVALTEPHLLGDGGDGKPVITFDVQRSGNRSVYGDLTAFYITPGAAPQIVAQANGLAVYSPYPLRHVRLALRPDARLAAGHAGRLRVEFRGRPEDHRVLLGSAEASL